MKSPQLHEFRKDLNQKLHRQYMERTYDNSEHIERTRRLIAVLEEINAAGAQTADILKSVSASYGARMNPSITAKFSNRTGLIKFLASLPEDVTIKGDFSFMGGDGEFDLCGAKYYVNTNVCEIKF